MFWVWHTQNNDHFHHFYSGLILRAFWPESLILTCKGGHHESCFLFYRSMPYFDGGLSDHNDPMMKPFLDSMKENFKNNDKDSASKDSGSKDKDRDSGKDKDKDKQKWFESLNDKLIFWYAPGKRKVHTRRLSRWLNWKIASCENRCCVGFLLVACFCANYPPTWTNQLIGRTAKPFSRHLQWGDRLAAQWCWHRLKLLKACLNVASSKWTYPGR